MYRVIEYAQVSLRQIAQVVLGAKLRIPGELLHTPVHITSLPLGRFHLCATRAAVGIAQLLRAEVPKLTFTDSASQRQSAERYLLYLNGATWDDVARQAEVEAALAAGTELLLVHEQRQGHDAVPFGTIIERTPSALLKLGVFHSLAVPLYDGEEHQHVCLRIMSAKFSKPPSHAS